MRPTGAEAEQLGLKLRIGPDDVEVEKKNAKSIVAQQLSQKRDGEGEGEGNSTLAQKHNEGEGENNSTLAQKHNEGEGENNSTLAQRTKSGVPVLVDPVLMKPTGAENMSLGLNIKVDGSTDIKLNKKLAQKSGVPVLVDPVLMKPTGTENATLGLNMRIGPDAVSVLKKPVQKTFLGLSVRNPVENPPYNNWSVNQPAVPHDAGWAAGADWEQDIIVDGHHVHY